MKEKLTFSILLLTIIAFSSCRRSVIEGEVFDNFGNPVKEATVKVEGTQFTTQTNGNGEYSVGYIPGEIKVLISKEGYTNTSFSINISTEATFPAAPTTIYQIPNENKIFIIQDDSYKPLTLAAVYKRNTDVFGNNSFGIYYAFSLDPGSILTIKKQDAELIFFDNDPEDQKLFRVYQIVGERLVFLFATVWGEKGTKVPEKYESLHSSFVKRHAQLGVGYYVFAQEQDDSFAGTPEDTDLGLSTKPVAYIFQVTE